MASATRADLLPALPQASRRQGEGGLTTAADLRSFLAAVLTADAADPSLAAALPVPQLQIRSFSGSKAALATSAGAGRLASPGGTAGSCLASVL